MKTQIETPVLKIRISDVIMYVLLIAVVFSLSSCSDDDDAKPDTRGQFIGTYAVEDVVDDDVDEYEITISNGTDGDLNISNFGDRVYAPVKATADGNKITIKPQSFTNPSSGKTLKISGSGTLSGNVLTFTYTFDGFLEYTANCKATKKAQ
jgi:hypothetical protein